VIQAGSSAFEPAGHVHIVRNEGDVPLVNVVMQLVPTGAPRLISQPSPGNCSGF
jgi:mannose-6-phosphate isomerase-like protein (cupin superfamily)